MIRRSFDSALLLGPEGVPATRACELDGICGPPHAVLGFARFAVFGDANEFSALLARTGRGSLPQVSEPIEHGRNVGGLRGEPQWRCGVNQC